MTSKEDWQGRVGQEWARQMPALEALLKPAGDVGMAALGDIAGRSVLDLGCGAGATTRALAAAGGVPTGLDISPDLLGLARTEAPDLTFVEGDAAITTFDQPFDALFSRCGAMFFDDPPAALAHIRTQLKPDAEAAFIAWAAPDQNLWASLPLHAAARILPEAGAPLAAGPGPFAWADPTTFAPVFETSGWNGLAWEPFSSTAPLALGDDPDPTARAADFVLRIGPLARRLRDQPSEVRSWIRTALKETFAEYLADGEVRVPITAWIITARA